jgi:hypothetical protein
MATVSSFIKAFEPAKKDHVVWLKKMTDIAETHGDPKRHQALVTEINSNPMGVKLDHRDALMWVEIHFGVAMKYTQAVLKGEAVIPATGRVASASELTPVTEE